jgi:DNA-binding protein H-NS
MASNLNTAKTLIQADLDHARNVLTLWTRQVAELEKALEQMEAVGNSRAALRVEYQTGATPAPSIDSPTPVNGKAKRGRKPKNPGDSTLTKSRESTTTLTAKHGRKLADRITAAPEQVSEAPSRKTRKITAAKNGRTMPAAKYKDPDSDKTWSGRGRRPGWFTGPVDQYEIRPQGRNASTENKATSEGAQAG